VSRVPGAPPRTSTAATAGRSGSTTVVPVRTRASSALPTLMPSTSVMRFRLPARNIMTKVSQRRPHPHKATPSDGSNLNEAVTSAARADRESCRHAFRRHKVSPAFAECHGGLVRKRWRQDQARRENMIQRHHAVVLALFLLAGCATALKDDTPLGG